MNTHERNPAEERLLDAALAQVLGEVRALPAVPPRRPTWFAAAIVLLGVLVAAAMLWQGRPCDVAPAQEPAPLPRAVTAEGRAAIEALPVDTQNLEGRIVEPEEADVFARFRTLRSLSIGALDMSMGTVRIGKDPAWKKPPADMLEVLSALRQLEILELSCYLAVSADVLRPLTRCARLRELKLVGERSAVDDDLVAVLRAIPNLRVLRFDLVRLDAAAVARLATLQLDELHISRCPGFDADGWGRVCAMASLRRLSFLDLGRRELEAKRPDQLLWRPMHDDLQHLRELRQLKGLAFRGCVLDDDDLLALPDTLEELTLSTPELRPEGFAHLRRFGRLRSLDVGTARFSLGTLIREPTAVRTAIADSIADALGALRLTKLAFDGALTEPLCTVIAAQPDLAELTLTCDRIASLAEIAKAPALRHLVLRELSAPPSLSLDDLRPLRESRTLRTLEVYTHEGIDEVAARKLLGERVTVSMSKWR